MDALKMGPNINMGIGWRLEDFGCYVLVIEEPEGDPTLFSIGIPAYDDLALDDEWIEVTAPQSQKFLDAVNKRYDTNFQMDDFAGR